MFQSSLSVISIVVQSINISNQYQYHYQYQYQYQYPAQVHTLVVSRNCDGILVSPMREEELKDTTVMVSIAIVIGASVVFAVLLVAVMGLAFYR